MTETSPLGSRARPPRGLSERGRPGDYRDTAGPADRRRRSAASSTTTASVLPHDGKAVGEIEVRGPWVTGVVLPGRRPGRSSTTAGCAPATSARIDPRGFITLTDRAKDVIKSGGEWISSVELENALMAHPAVAEAAVVGVPDERWQRAAAGVRSCSRTASRVTAAELRDFLAERVAKWRLPERWAFIDEVPEDRASASSTRRCSAKPTPTASSTRDRGPLKPGP